ncbi:tetratricopeptide repeat (TPR)-like superfamily protein isoform X2 [Carex rostrata]
MAGTSGNNGNDRSSLGFLDRLDGWGDLLNENSLNLPDKSSMASSSRTIKEQQGTSKFAPEKILNYTGLGYPSLSHDEAVPDAASEKELGNEYFKQKKFKEAIGCYSRSIALTPTAVAFANRAMAYLKIRRFEEAETDCTEALNLDDRYVKAYSRRATARKELGKLKEAMEDAEFAVSIEPNTQELRKQYDDIKALYMKEMAKKISGTAKSSVPEVHKPSSSAPQNAKAASVMGTDAKARESPLISIQESKVAKEASKESVQAVMNRRNEAKESVEDLASRAVSHFSSKHTKNIVVPKSAYEFEVSWKALSDDCHMQAHLLKMISPTSLPQIFKNSLSASILVDIVKCTSTFFREETELAIAILDNLTKVLRFDMISMCLSQFDRTEMRRIWNEVFSAEAVPMDHVETLTRLRSKYLHE